MAIAELTGQRQSGGAAAATAALYISLTGNPTAGNLIVAAFSWRGNATISSVPAGGGPAWNTVNGGDQGDIDCALFYRIADGSTPTDITVNVSTAVKYSAVISEWSGIATTTPLDKTNSGVNTGTAGTTGATGVLSQADELVVCVFANPNVYTWSSYDNGATELAEAASSGGSAGSRQNTAVATKIVSATTSVNYGATLSTSAAWTSLVATFKAAAAAPFIAKPPFTKLQAVRRSNLY